MKRRLFLTLVAWLVCLLAAPTVTHAKKRSLAQHAKMEAKRRAFARAALRKAKTAKRVLKHSTAQRAVAKKLRRKLSKKQRAALHRFSRMMLNDARRAAKRRKKKFAVSAKRLRPHVVAIGSKNANALAAASMIGAAEQAEKGVIATAKALQRNLDRKKKLRSNISELRDIITEGSFPIRFSYGSPAKTVQLTSKAQAESLMHKLESELETITDMSQQMQLQLQDAMNKQQQAMQILSNIMKNQHDTLKAIIQNMR